MRFCGGWQFCTQTSAPINHQFIYGNAGQFAHSRLFVPHLNCTFASPSFLILPFTAVSPEQLRGRTAHTENASVFFLRGMANSRFYSWKGGDTLATFPGIH